MEANSAEPATACHVGARKLAHYHQICCLYIAYSAIIMLSPRMRFQRTASSLFKLHFSPPNLYKKPRAMLSVFAFHIR